MNFPRFSDIRETYFSGNANLQQLELNAPVIPSFLLVAAGVRLGTITRPLFWLGQFDHGCYTWIMGATWPPVYHCKRDAEAC